ncbi:MULTISPECIES: hypothetical protein [unclassified Streptomyces]|uniref:hypothetical protein n=1 Tax=unclassified Streptomyces TaxID=2593676 RepID=UPI00117D51AE|nr:MULTISPECIES: hypothetical protein [unclassified Streptomyces]
MSNRPAPALCNPPGAGGTKSPGPTGKPPDGRASPAAVAAYVTAAPCTSPPMTYADECQEAGGAASAP